MLGEAACRDAELWAPLETLLAATFLPVEPGHFGAAWAALGGAALASKLMVRLAVDPPVLQVQTGSGNLHSSDGAKQIMSHHPTVLMIIWLIAPICNGAADSIKTYALFMGLLGMFGMPQLAKDA